MAEKPGLSQTEREEINGLLKITLYLSKLFVIRNPDKMHYGNISLVNYFLGFLSYAQNLEVSQHIENCKKCKSKYELIKRYLYRKSKEFIGRFVVFHGNGSDRLDMYEKLMKKIFN